MRQACLCLNPPAHTEHAERVLNRLSNLNRAALRAYRIGARRYRALDRAVARTRRVYLRAMAGGVA